MSKSIFPQCDGRVALISSQDYCDDSSQLFKIYLNNEPITLPVTGFALEVGGNYQFLHTVSDFIYFYSFGDRVGELTVTGMAFIKRACNTGVGVETAWPSYLNPGNWNINPLSPEFWNNPNWIDKRKRFLGWGQQANSICDVWDLYTRFRSHALAQGEALRVTWGVCEAFHGFLTGMRVEIARPDIPVAQFVLRLHIVRR